MPRFLLYTIFSLSSVFAHAQTTQRLCYSTVHRNIQTGVFNDGVALGATPRNLRHELALRASALIYKLADLDIASTGAELLTSFEEFQRQIPRGYTYDYFFMNRGSGLKYMILSPVNPTDPWIFAFAGTQTAIDWMSDVTLGRAQFAQAESLLYNFTNCEYDNGSGKSLGSRNWIITGHSLGGGLAETFAYLAQKRRLAAGLSVAPIELVTFNAFGALELVEDSVEAAAPITRTLATANYFVTGDLISRIGTHIGATYELQLPKASIFQAANRHVIDTVWSAALKDGVPQFNLSRAATPPSSGLLNALKNHASFFKFLPSNQSDNLITRLNHMNILEEALNIIIRRNQGGSYDREANSYLNRMALVFLNDEQQKPLTGARKELIARLESFLNRSSTLINNR